MMTRLRTAPTLLSFLTFAALTLTATAASAQGPGDPGGGVENFCAAACTAGTLCTEDCKLPGGTWIQCGEYWGNPSYDLDGDGVSNASDNCVCTPNSSQANCDGDAYGDACDPTNGGWTLISTSSQACEIQAYNNFGGTGQGWMTINYGYTYQNSCTGQTCTKPVSHAQFWCSTSTATPQCCTNNWSYSDCNAVPWNTNYCGGPACPF